MADNSSSDKESIAYFRSARGPSNEKKIDNYAHFSTRGPFSEILDQEQKTEQSTVPPEDKAAALQESTVQAAAERESNPASRSANSNNSNSTS